LNLQQQPQQQQQQPPRPPQQQQQPPPQQQSSLSQMLQQYLQPQQQQQQPVTSESSGLMSQLHNLLSQTGGQQPTQAQSLNHNSSELTYGYGQGATQDPSIMSQPTQGGYNVNEGLYYEQVVTSYAEPPQQYTSYDAAYQVQQQNALPGQEAALATHTQYYEQQQQQTQLGQTGEMTIQTEYDQTQTNGLVQSHQEIHMTLDTTYQQTQLDATQNTWGFAQQDPMALQSVLQGYQAEQVHGFEAAQPQGLMDMSQLQQQQQLGVDTQSWSFDMSSMQQQDFSSFTETTTEYESSW
jgi:hypothetical protein